MKNILGLLILLFATACGTNDPKAPEASITPVEQLNHKFEAVEVSTPINKNNVTVRHTVKGNDVYVEVIVPGFKFASEGKKRNVIGEGFIKLSLNGVKIDEIHQAAFIVKGLPTGRHLIKVELVNNDSTSYGFKEEIAVSIP